MHRHPSFETCVSFDALLSMEIGFGIAPATTPAARPIRPVGLKLFNEAHASISVPSTVKWSVDSSFFTRG